MKLLKVIAVNFRTLKDVKIDFLSDYCTLSGKNNAGKSAVVKILEHFFEDDDNRFYRDERLIRYDRDSTQWEKGPIILEVHVSLNKSDDSELFFFVDKFAPSKLTSEKVEIKLISKFDSGSSGDEVFVDGLALDKSSTAEVLKKFKSAATRVIHNSTRDRRQYFYRGDELFEFIESQFSDIDNRKIDEAQKMLHSRVETAAKKHKQGLTEYLGRLNERYEIELVPPDRGRSERVPLSVRLGDKSVEVPLHEWGTGTQNRTRVLISVFGAARARSTASPSDRVTPIVIIEEPESFLHPSAQAEFGKILNQLASEVKIQIIATTHSPYMLNQTEPDGNILLDRKIHRGLLRETQIVETRSGNWMKPFAENLGIIPEDFIELKNLFKEEASRVVLVEGPIDKDYFDHIKEKYPAVYQISGDVQIVPFGGKDTLKNTTLIKFILSRFKKVYITFDLDTEKDCKPALERLGLVEIQNFCPVGLKKPGQDRIEGLVPDTIKSSVSRDNPDLVMAMAADSTERRKAKDNFKLKLLDEFKKADLNEADLKDFRALFKKIAKQFS